MRRLDNFEGIGKVIIERDVLADNSTISLTNQAFANRVYVSTVVPANPATGVLSLISAPVPGSTTGVTGVYNNLQPGVWHKVAPFIKVAEARGYTGIKIGFEN